MPLPRLLSWAVLALLLAPAPPVRAAVERLGLEQAAGRLGGGGFVLMMRHAQTEPGIGDPPGFRIGDCATQRLLSAAGREQARRAGEAMRAAGIRIGEVLSSEWCRCQDTARLAFGAYRTAPELNSFFDDASARDRRTSELHGLVRQHRDGNLMLVTHQVNISAAFDSLTSPAEIVAGRWRDGRLVAEFRFVPLSD